MSKKVWLGLFLVIGVFLFLRPARLQEGKSTPSGDTAADTETDLGSKRVQKLNQILKNKIQTLQKARKSYHQVLRNKEQQVQQARTRLEILQRDVSDTSSARDRKKKQLEKLKSKHESLSKTVQDLQSRVKTTSNIARRFRKQLRTYIRHTVPYRTDSRLRRLRNDQLPVDKKPIQALNALWDAARTERSDSRTSEVFTEQVTLPDNRKKHARMIRIGHNLLYFKTEDGNEVGRAVMDEDGSWRWQMPSRTSGISSTKWSGLVTRSLNMIQDEVRPQFLFLPVDLRTPSER